MIVDGVELLRMIRDEEIKDGTIIKCEETGALIVENGLICFKNLMMEDEERHRPIAQITIMKYKFEILSEENEEEIDIQAIEEIHFLTGANDNELDIGNKINEIIKAIKQIDKKLK